MNLRVSTLIGVVLAMVLAAATRWSGVPLARHGKMRGDCSTCHARSAPLTHTLEFIERGHGPAALQSRQECLACHSDPETSCDECHRERPPDWHTDDFRNPRLGTFETREHIRIARSHHESCIECHAATYTTGCVDCHRPEEDWLGRTRKGNR